MIKKLPLIIFAVFSICSSNLFAVTKDSLHVATKKLPVKTETTSKVFRNFSSLKEFDVVKPTTVQKRFSKGGYIFNSPDSLKNKKWLDMATNTFTTIEKDGNFIDQLTPNKLFQLPVGITPVEISNVKYTVGIAKATFKPTYTELTVFLKVEVPSKNDKRGDQVLILGATDVKLSHEGGIIGDAKLNLISQFTLNVNSGAMLLTLKGSFEKPGTYALIDCSGFKGMGIDANLKFANGIIHPVDEKGKKKLGYVEADFKTTITDWNNLLINISLPEFGIKGVGNTTFRLNTAILDFSDLENDPATPSSYVNKFYEGAPNLWRGVYVKSLQVVLPQEFKTKNSSDRLSFGATDLIIDEQGISGEFSADNLIDINKGSASGWKFSLEKFMLDIEANSLKGSALEGKIMLPVSKVDKIGYTAEFQPDNMTLTLQNLSDKLHFDLWKSKVKLNTNSYIEMKVADGNFLPKASLSGSLDLNTPLGKTSSNDNSEDSIINFKGIEFEELVLQPKSPNITLKYFGVKGKLKLANFPVSLDRIGVEIPSDNKIKLVFGIDVNLTNETDGGNGGGTTLAINGIRVDKNWKFDGVDLNHLDIKMEVAGTKLQGAIFIFEDDPVYGTGFAGAIGAEFSKGIELGVKVKALFGRKDDFRYWFADGQVSLPTGVPVFPGFAINMFGGGFYNRMKMAGFNSAPDATFKDKGASSSGVIYEPYKENSFGMKATLGFIMQNSEDVVNGSFEFGMSFRKTGGLQEIYLKGNAKLLTELPGNFQNQVLDNLKKIAKRKEKEATQNDFLPAKPQDGAVTANMFIGYDFVNESFSCNAEVYFNLGIIKGVGDYGRAGWLSIYAGKDSWHVLAGIPEDPVGINIDLAILELEMKSYFMTGKDLPPSPRPPQEVADALGEDIAKLDYMRDLNMLESGTGLAFGANLAMRTGDLTFLIFYGSFTATMGFDIMLKDYGEARCKGSSEQIGMNGWYANGQSYASMAGELGLTFKLFGSKKKFPILSNSAGMLLQGRLPNPSWFRGYMVGDYNFLGGLIKGGYRFKVEIGKKCEITNGSPLEGLTVIGDLKPKDKASQVDVFAAPQASFNFPINKMFELPELKKKYKIILDEFSVTKDGKPVKGTIEWSYANDVATFYSHEILPPNSNLKAYVQLHFEELTNNGWKIFKDKGKTYTETKEVTFTTGTAPNNIPLTNIEYMYPVLGQKNFLKDEYNVGYVNLKRGQEYLFTEAGKWKKAMTLTSSKEQKINTVYAYNAAKKQITYAIPREMENTTSYEVGLKLIADAENIDNNTSEKVKTKNVGGKNSGNSITVKSTILKKTASKSGEKELLTYSFRTSKYSTFKSKISNLRKNGDLYDHISKPYELILQTAINYNEEFDLVDIRGNKYSGNKPLVVARAALDDSYYKKEIYPMLYKSYPLYNSIRVKRKTENIGVPPIEAVQPMTWYITDLENRVEGDVNKNIPFSYNLSLYYLQDYQDLGYQLLNSKYPWEKNPVYVEMITKTFPLMKKGTYRSKLHYNLPGQTKSLSNKEIKYKNPIN